jgi:hypothetical protein
MPRVIHLSTTLGLGMPRSTDATAVAALRSGDRRHASFRLQERPTVHWN